MKAIEFCTQQGFFDSVIGQPFGSTTNVSHSMSDSKEVICLLQAIQCSLVGEYSRIFIGKTWMWLTSGISLSGKIARGLLGIWIDISDSRSGAELTRPEFGRAGPESSTPRECVDIGNNISEVTKLSREGSTFNRGPNCKMYADVTFSPNIDGRRIWFKLKY